MTERERIAEELRKIANICASYEPVTLPYHYIRELLLAADVLAGAHGEEQSR